MAAAEAAAGSPAVSWLDGVRAGPIILLVAIAALLLGGWSWRRRGR